jgi:hypothetical protein
MTRRLPFRFFRSSARILLAVVGGYAFSASASALLAVTLPRLTNMDRGEAVVLAAMLGFLIYLVVLLWAFAARRLARVGVALVGGASLGFGLLGWLSAGL